MMNISEEIKNAFDMNDELIPPFYDIGSPFIHENAQIKKKLISIIITTPLEQWAYAISFEKKLLKLENYVLKTPILIRVTVKIINGAIGIGILNNAGDYFLDETFVRTDKKKTVDLLIPSIDQLGSLIIRNISEDNQPSQLELFEIEYFSLKYLKRNKTLSLPLNTELKATPNWNQIYGNSNHSFHEKLRIHEFESLSEPITMDWLENLKFKIYPKIQTSKAIYVSGLYEPNSMLIAKKFLKPGSTFIDIGANAGTYSLMASQWVGQNGKVIAFEPSSREYELLLENIVLNKLTNIKTEKLAIGEQSKEAILTLADQKYNGHNTLGDSFAYGVCSHKKESIRVITLDHYVKKNSIKNIDVIKLDIEGSEYKALIGAKDTLNQYHPILIIEICPRALEINGTCTENILNFLSNFHYKFYRIDDISAELISLENNLKEINENIVAVSAYKKICLTHNH